jgi:hypothetical protein
MIEIGDKVLILLMEDEYYGREGIVVETSRSLAKVKFADGAFRYYNKMNKIDIQKI